MLTSITKFICITFLLASCGYHGYYYPITIRGEKGISAEAENDIREMAIRNMLPRKQRQAVVYISFGKENSKEIDPPHDFFQRLDDLDMEIRPVSQQPSESDIMIFYLSVEVDHWFNEMKASVKIRKYIQYTEEQAYETGYHRSWGRLNTKAKWTDGIWRMDSRNVEWIHD